MKNIRMFIVTMISILAVMHAVSSAGGDALDAIPYAIIIAICNYLALAIGYTER